MYLYFAMEWSPGFNDTPSPKYMLDIRTTPLQDFVIEKSLLDIVASLHVANNRISEASLLSTDRITAENIPVSACTRSRIGCGA